MPPLSFFKLLAETWKVNNLKLIFTTNFIEFVDLYFFIHCAPIIEKIFVPPEWHGWMSSIALWFSYGIPPLAAFVFGAVGDNRGRRFTMLFSSTLMCLLTVSLVILPSYDQIGIWSLILFISIRFCQAVSIAAEGACAWVFGYESTQSFSKTAFTVPFISMGEGLSGVFSLLGFLGLFAVLSFLGEEMIVRMLFAVLSVAFIWVLSKRKELKDVKDYLDAREQLTYFGYRRITEVIKNHNKQLGCLAAIMMAYPLAFNISYIYMPELLKLHFAYSDHDVMLHNILITASEMIISVSFGYLAYRLEIQEILNRKWLALAIAFVSFFASVVFYLWFSANTPTYFMITLTQILMLVGVLSLGFLVGNFYQTFAIIGRFSSAAFSWACARIIGLIIGIAPMQWLHSCGGYEYFLCFTALSLIQIIGIYLSRVPVIEDWQR